MACLRTGIAGGRQFSASARIRSRSRKHRELFLHPFTLTLDTGHGAIDMADQLLKKCPAFFASEFIQRHFLNLLLTQDLKPHRVRSARLTKPILTLHPAHRQYLSLEQYSLSCFAVISQLPCSSRQPMKLFDKQHPQVS